MTDKETVKNKKVLKKKASSKKVSPKKDVKTKKTSKKAEVKKDVKKSEAKEVRLRYYEAVGRRRRAVARVRLFTKGEKGFLVNTKPYLEYFKTPELRGSADGALRKMKVMDKFNVSVFVRGGGISGQAEAVRHGTARALLEFNPDFRKRLKRAGFLRRDPREKERRKFGLRKARRAPQWSKR